MTSIAEELGYITEAIRKKLIPIIVVIFAGFMGSFYLLDPVLERMKRDLLPEGATLIYISPVEVIMLKLKIAFIIGIILAVPLIWHYVYKTLKVRFGLKNPIKKPQLIILIIAAVSMFIVGICYSYFLMMPLVLNYLYVMSSAAGVAATYSIYEFISFVVTLTFLVGVAFEIPILIVFTVKAGLVQTATLKEYRRYVIVAIFVVAAFFTPPDVPSQLIVAFPMVIFYEVGIVAADFLTRKRPGLSPSRSQAS
jgi:sec-independent protein translocase protein TatC